MSYNVLQGVERWLDVILTSQADGITPIIDTVYSDVAVRYRKEGAVASVSKTLASGTTDWINQDAGVYRVRFTGTELNTLGSLTYSVTDISTDFMPYYGHVNVVSGDVTTITTNLTTVGNNVLGVSGRVETAITDILNVDSDLITVGNNVLGVSGDVLVVSSDVLEVSGRVETAITDILAVDNSLTTVGNDVLGVSGRVETAITDILALDSSLTIVGNDVLGVSGRVETAITDILAVDSNLIVVGNNVIAISGNVLVVDGKVEALQTSVSGLNSYMVGAGAYYDSDAHSLTTSLVLHKNGDIVSTPISATIVGYTEAGASLFTDTSSSPDAQGVFKFVESVTLSGGTIPYIRGTIVDSDGTHRTITLTPVVA